MTGSARHDRLNVLAMVIGDVGYILPLWVALAAEPRTGGIAAATKRLASRSRALDSDAQSSARNAEMDDLSISTLLGLTPGDAAALDAEVQLKLSQAEQCETPLAAAKLQAEARGLQILAKHLRAPPAAGLPELLLGRGGEVSPLHEPSMPLVMGDIATTLHSPPDMLAAQASMSRLTLARDAGVLTEAVDAAESIGADGALEQMMVHQIAAAHRLSMQLMTAANAVLCIHDHGQYTNGGGGKLAEASRCALAAARLMDGTTRTAVALDRMRNGGRQHVTVQHVVVEDGGQAVVAGTVAPGGDRALGKRRGQGRRPQ